MNPLPHKAIPGLALHFSSLPPPRPPPPPPPSPPPPRRYLNALQTNAPHLLRYLCAAALTCKRRRSALRDVARVAEQEAHAYSDPLTALLLALLVEHDFDGAQQRMAECEEVRGRGEGAAAAECLVTTRGRKGIRILLLIHALLPRLQHTMYSDSLRRQAP